jgi:hypothetical protein
MRTPRLPLMTEPESDSARYSPAAARAAPHPSGHRGGAHRVGRARFDRSFALQIALLTLRGRTAVFGSPPGSNFTVNGAVQSKNLALVTAWAGTFEGEFSDNTRGYAGTVWYNVCLNDAERSANILMFGRDLTTADHRKSVFQLQHLRASALFLSPFMPRACRMVPRSAAQINEQKIGGLRLCSARFARSHVMRSRLEQFKGPFLQPD